MCPSLGSKLSVFIALAPAVYAGPLTTGFPFTALNRLEWSTWKRFFGVLDFIPLMRWAYDYAPAKLFVSSARILSPCVQCLYRIGYFRIVSCFEPSLSLILMFLAWCLRSCLDGRIRIGKSSLRVFRSGLNNAGCTVGKRKCSDSLLHPSVQPVYFGELLLVPRVQLSDSRLTWSQVVRQRRLCRSKVYLGRFARSLVRWSFPTSIYILGRQRLPCVDRAVVREDRAERKGCESDKNDKIGFIRGATDISVHLPWMMAMYNVDVSDSIAISIGQLRR